MRKPILLVVVALMLLAGWWLQRPASTSAGDSSTIAAAPAASGSQQAGAGRATRAEVTDTDGALPAFLPAEARDTLDLIARGGPFPHRQDGSVFGNRERNLPQQPRGYYHEYTVQTPGLSHRGARRIVTGGNPPSEYWYTDDHYDSFRRFDPGH